MQRQLPPPPPAASVHVQMAWCMLTRPRDTLRAYGAWLEQCADELSASVVPPTAEVNLMAAAGADVCHDVRYFWRLPDNTSALGRPGSTHAEFRAEVVRPMLRAIQLVSAYAREHLDATCSDSNRMRELALYTHGMRTDEAAFLAIMQLIVSDAWPRETLPVDCPRYQMLFRPGETLGEPGVPNWQAVISRLRSDLATWYVGAVTESGI